MKFKSALNNTLVLVVALFSVKSVLAAGPVTHAYLAEKWLQKREHYNEKETESLIRGTLFPDIRYLGVISREATHVENVTLQDLKADKDAFSKGKKLHSFIDKEREKMAVQWGIYEKLKRVPGQQYISTFLKLLEDEIIFQKSNWSEVKESLKIVDANERLAKINIEDLLRWHQLLARSFTVLPSKHLETLGKRDKYFFNVPPKVVKRWSKVLPLLAQDPAVQDYVATLDAHFDTLFKK